MVVFWLERFELLFVFGVAVLCQVVLGAGRVLRAEKETMKLKWTEGQ
jgi:hypothetical protein